MCKTLLRAGDRAPSWGWEHRAIIVCTLRGPSIRRSGGSNCLDDGAACLQAAMLFQIFLLFHCSERRECKRNEKMIPPPPRAFPTSLHPTAREGGRHVVNHDGERRSSKHVVSFLEDRNQGENAQSALRVAGMSFAPRRCRCRHPPALVSFRSHLSWEGGSSRARPIGGPRG